MLVIKPSLDREVKQPIGLASCTQDDAFESYFLNLETKLNSFKNVLTLPNTNPKETMSFSKVADQHQDLT